jgi:hypothetical protein
LLYCIDAPEGIPVVIHHLPASSYICCGNDG